MKFNKYFYLSAALAFALCSCSDNDETGGDFTPTIFNVMGKVEKGPMIRAIIKKQVCNTTVTTIHRRSAVVGRNPGK